MFFNLLSSSAKPGKVFLKYCGNSVVNCAPVYNSRLHQVALHIGKESFHCFSLQWLSCLSSESPSTRKEARWKTVLIAFTIPKINSLWWGWFPFNQRAIRQELRPQLHLRPTWKLPRKADYSRFACLIPNNVEMKQHTTKEFETKILIRPQSLMSDDWWEHFVN